jgi:nitrite reductase/ring-hydroxylating ferredoxin subunit
MSTPIRIARVDELPPGKGKVVQLGARDITVYNLEGRYYATGTRPFHVGGALPPGHADSLPVCAPPHGQRFETTAADSPAETERGEARYDVTVDGEFVVIFVEDALAD